MKFRILALIGAALFAVTVVSGTVSGAMPAADRSVAVEQATAIAPASAIMPPAFRPATEALERRYSSTFLLGGTADAPRTVKLEDLMAMPPQEITVTFTAAGKAQRHTYRGVRLYDLATSVKPRFNLLQKNDALSWYVQVRATDNYIATVAWGEIAPAFQNKSVLVVYEEDGKLLGDADGMARLVVPGDQRGGRYVSNIASIAVLQSYQMGR
ncbi:MAG: molybdopterin-dependent oxidoreductase [Chloroflexi bacterium]|nr:molybdopterin-dependent oxidoreductase [Chloroflexota bacterium]